MGRDPQARTHALTSPAHAAAFVLEHTRRHAPPLVPEIGLHLADDALPLWRKTEEELAADGLPPPFWAFAWAGGQALARYLLDNPATVRGRTVLDVGAGSGLVAIAAARAGAARVVANEIDPFALAAIALNAAANGVSIEPLSGDILDTASTRCRPDRFASLLDAGPAPGPEVALIGDLFYERDLARRALAFARGAKAAGATVLVGDPRRSYLPVETLEPIATYEVEVTRALEDAERKRTTVFRLR